MSSRRPAAGQVRTLGRAYRELVRDAVAMAGACLVELIVRRDGGGGPPWRTAAFAAPRTSAGERAELARALAHASAELDLPEPRWRGGYRTGRCDPGLMRLLGRRGLQQVLLPLATDRVALGWLRVVAEGRPGREALRACQSAARAVWWSIEAVALRRELAASRSAGAREVAREKRALVELSQAKDTLGALNLAGTHLMVETDEAAIYGVICRELLRIGFPSAVLTAERGPTGPLAPYRYVFTSFTAPVQRATERVLGRALSELRVDPGTAPLVARVLREGRTVYTARAREAARQLLGQVSDPGIRKLERLLALRHVAVAPLRFRGGISGLLVVASPRLRRGDAAGIDTFALQASIALEKAHLFSELKLHQSQLESEVERRTRELTRAVAALKELDRRKDNFLANVSHELRTPLVTVLGYTDLVLSEKLGEISGRQRECLRITAASARRLRSFIDELLELSRYDLTRDRRTFSAFDLRDLVHQAVMSVAPRFHERGIYLRARVARATPLAWGDRNRVLQVFMNLLSNAERHSTDATHVRIIVAPDRSGRLAVAVSDEGQGIPPEHLDRIFDRLYQVGDVVKQRDKGAGLGLGLAIVKSIVEAHGGEITVRSRVGRGTRFRFSLPSAGEREQHSPGASAPVTSPAG